MSLGLGLGLGLSRNTARSVAPAGSFMTTTNSQFIGGPRRLVSGFSGNIIRLRRSSDNAQLDYACASGSDQLDYAAILTWTGGSDPNVVSVYDQSPSGLGWVATNATAAQQPILAISQKDQFAAGAPIVFSAVASTICGLTISGQNFDHRNFAAVAGVYAMGMQSQNRILTLRDASVTYEALESGSGFGGQLGSNSGSGGVVNVTGAKTRYLASRPQATAFLGNGTTERRVWANGGSTGLTANSTAAPGTGINLTFGSPTGGAWYRSWGWCVYQAQTAVFLDARVAEMSTIIGEVPYASLTGRLVFVGDSIMWGQNAKTNANTVYQLQKLGLPTTIEVINVGNPGKLLAGAAGFDAQYAQTAGNSPAGPWYTAAFGSNIWAFLEGGCNDFATGQTFTDADSYTAATSWQTKCKASGYTKTIIGTLLPRGDASYQTSVEQAYNTRVSGNAGSFDYIVDFANDAVMGFPALPGGAYNDATLYNSSDKTHPTDLGYSHTGATALTAIRAVVGF